MQNTMVELCGFDHSSDFWTRMLLQRSQAFPAVHHAIVALSSLHEDLVHTKDDDLGCMKRQKVFLQQFNKAIGYLRSRRNEQNVQATLSCCVVFICVEMARGNHDIALKHLESGLQILKEWKATQGTSTSEELDDITEVFRRLDMQATVFLNSRKPELAAMSNSTQVEYNIPSSFSTLREAQTWLEKIEMRLLQLLTSKRASHNTPEIGLLILPALLLQAISASFTQWKSVFDSFLLRSSPILQTKDLQMGVLLNLHYKTMTLMLELQGGSKEAAGYELGFSQINELSRSLIKSNPTSGKFMLSADTGVIGPLYYAAMHTTKPETCQHSISLLRHITWKEGLWDAGTAADIAEGIWRAKSQDITSLVVSGGIPELAQVHNIGKSSSPAPGSFQNMQPFERV